ncbi:MAG: glycosyltransferase [Actinobacteria bacterium]|nr:glycosyltransferase [Actinomycetota bacterium]
MKGYACTHLPSGSYLNENKGQRPGTLHKFPHRSRRIEPLSANQDGELLEHPRPEEDSSWLPSQRVTIDAIVPARNEAPTVGRVVEACLGCPVVREVIVVDDGSTDNTGEIAARAGAKVIRREDYGGRGGSKAHAMAAGVAMSDAEALLFVDADLIGLESTHLEQICRPFLEGRAVMSLGFFDYGPILNPIVARMPPMTGERVLPRWVFEMVPPWLMDGYTIEVMLDKVVVEARLPVVARVMSGVTHRTKRDKLGKLEGYRQSLAMFSQLLRLPFTGVVKWRLYLHYLRSVVIEEDNVSVSRP